MEFSEVSVPARERDISSSGLSWSAVIGGAFVIAALSVIMLALGTGFGLTVVSPGSNVGMSASTAGSIAIIWLIFTELIACLLGGYLTGRLRTRWAVIQQDEAHFRDTANGFLAWAVSVVIVLTFLGTAATSMAGGLRGSDDSSGRTSEEAHAGILPSEAYFVDRLFRSEHTAPENDASRGEAARLFTHILARHGQNDVVPADTARLAQLVSAKTGMNTADANQCVSDTINAARQSEDKTRKAIAHLLLWIFLALLIGAFCASYAATIGGRQRDHVRTI
jgi:hypothetical protein